MTPPSNQLLAEGTACWHVNGGRERQAERCTGLGWWRSPSREPIESLCDLHSLVGSVSLRAKRKSRFTMLDLAPIRGGENYNSTTGQVLAAPRNRCL